MSRRRVVITGIGFCSSLGYENDQVFANLLAGKSGIRPIQNLDVEGFTTTIAGEIPDFDREQWMDRRTARRVDDFSAFGIAAAKQAMDDSKLETDSIDLDRAGIIIGSGIGGINEIETQHVTLMHKGPGKVSPHFVPRLMSNATVGQLSIRYGFRGTSFTTTSACSSGAHAAGMALRAIQYGDADVVMTGGCEAAITRLGLIGFCSARAMSTRNDDPEHASRPFDLHRDGFVMGEGAGVLLFEELEHAKARGARIYAEVLGYGSTSDAYHMTAPSSDGDGARRVMTQALADGGIEPSRVTYINAHGTSTALNDSIETTAIKATFGEEHARKIPISSTKSMLGHLLGAAPGVELGVTALSVFKGQVHPTANYETPDPECDLDYITEGPRDLAEMDVAISNSFGFGGHNACLAIARYRA